MVPSLVNDIYIIRFAVCAKYANDDDMRIAFNIIQEHADAVLTEYRAQRGGRQSSNDSIDLTSKPAATINNAEEDETVEAETTNTEILPETPVAPIIYPANRVRVNKLKLFSCFVSK